MSIIGLGWGRATRSVKIKEAVKGKEAKISIDALKKDKGEESIPKIGEEKSSELIEGKSLFNPDTTGRVIILWILTPTISAIASYHFFLFFPV